MPERTKKASYQSKVKQVCRRYLREFIEAHFNEVKIRTARVLCFPGPEALEIHKIYVPLGIPCRNIIGLEHDREIFNRLRRSHLGVQLRNQTLASFLEERGTAPFDIVSLDFNGHLATNIGSLQRLRERGLLDDEAIVITNFCGAREADASKGYYHISRANLAGLCGIDYADDLGRKKTPTSRRASASRRGSGSIDWCLQSSLPEWRSHGIHDTVRSTFTKRFPVMAEMLYRQLYRRGTPDRRMQRLIDTLQRLLCEVEHLELAKVPRQMLAAIRNGPLTAPAPLMHVLDREVKSLLRSSLRRFSKHTNARRYALTSATNLLAFFLDLLLSRPSTVLAAQSLRYVSDRGTPMYCDMFRLKRMDECDFLGMEFRVGARSLAAFLAPLSKMTPERFESLLRTLCDRARALTKYASSEEIPERVNLGSERQLYRARPDPKLDKHMKRAVALAALHSSPYLTNEDVAVPLNVGAMQVAGWKAHMTMGTYSPESRRILQRLRERTLCDGRFAEALEISARLLKREPRSTVLLKEHANILQQLGRHQRALEFTQRALSVAPSDAVLWAMKGYQLHRLGELGGAIEAYEEALELDPLSAKNRVMLGFMELQRGDPVEARVHFDAVLKLDPTCSQANCGSAAVVLAGGDVVGALRILDRTANEHPNDANVLQRRADLLSRLERHREAVRDLRAATRLRPDDVLIQCRLAGFLITCGRRAHALVAFRKAVAIDPIHPHALLGLGMLHLELGEPSEAIQVLNQAAKHHPADVRIRLCRARAMIAYGRGEDALAQLNYSVLLAPPSIAQHLEQAELLLSLGRVPEARREFRSVLRSEPLNPVALLGLAWVEIERKAYTSALNVLKRLAVPDGQTSEALLCRGMALVSSGQAVRGMCDLDDVLKINPRNLQALDAKGRALAGLGRHTAAIRCFDRALRADPGASGPLEAKAESLIRLNRLGEATETYAALLRARLAKQT